MEQLEEMAVNAGPEALEKIKPPENFGAIVPANFMELNYTPLYEDDEASHDESQKVQLAYVPGANSSDTSNWIIRLRPNSTTRNEQASTCYRVFLLEGIARFLILRKGDRGLKETTCTICTPGESIKLENGDEYLITNSCSDCCCFLWFVEISLKAYKRKIEEKEIKNKRSSRCEDTQLFTSKTPLHTNPASPFQIKLNEPNLSNKVVNFLPWRPPCYDAMRSCLILPQRQLGSGESESSGRNIRNYAGTGGEGGNEVQSYTNDISADEIDLQKLENLLIHPGRARFIPFDMEDEGNGRSVYILALPPRVQVERKKLGNEVTLIGIKGNNLWAYVEESLSPLRNIQYDKRTLIGKEEACVIYNSDHDKAYMFFVTPDKNFKPQDFF